MPPIKATYFLFDFFIRSCPQLIYISNKINILKAFQACPRESGEATTLIPAFAGTYLKGAEYHLEELATIGNKILMPHKKFLLTPEASTGKVQKYLSEFIQK